MEKELTREEMFFENFPTKEQVFDSETPTKGWDFTPYFKEKTKEALSQAYQAGMNEIGRKCLGAVPEKDGGDRVGFYDLSAQGHNEARTAILTVLKDSGVEVTETP